jgi:hypothetical protein
MTDANRPEDNAPDKGKGRTIAVSDETFVFRTVEVPGHKVTGAQVAKVLGREPVEEYALLLNLPNGEIETLRPDQEIDLAAKVVERFFIIKSSESFRFVVDHLSLEWPIKSILGKHIKVLIHAGDDKELVLEQDDGPAKIIGDDDLVHLDAPGVERLKTRPAPRTVTVIYNHNSYTLERRVYSTEELFAAFKVPAGYKLDLVEHDGEFRELKPGEKILAREGMEFASHPPRGQSS